MSPLVLRSSHKIALISYSSDLSYTAPALGPSNTLSGQRAVHAHVELLAASWAIQTWVLLLLLSFHVKHSLSSWFSWNDEGLSFTLPPNICLLVWREPKLFVILPGSEPLLHLVELHCRDHCLISLPQLRDLTFLRPLSSLTGLLKQNKKRNKEKTSS